MKKSIGLVFLMFVFLTVLLSGCAPASTPVPSTPVPPTLTSVPPTDTPTPKPTKTPIPPTPTVEPPTALSKYLNNVTVSNITTFDTAPNFDYNSELVHIQDGKLQFQGKDWQGGIDSRLKYKEGQGVVFDFMFDSSQSPSGYEFETYFDMGTWWTPSYRRFGVYITLSPQADMWVGQRGTGKYLTGDLKLTPDVWYQVMVVIDKKADFLSVIWNPNNPDVIRKYRIPEGGDWSGQNWHFAINGSKGSIVIDNLMGISFDSIK